MAGRRREAVAMVTRTHLLRRSLFRSAYSLPREDGRRAIRGPFAVISATGPGHTRSFELQVELSFRQDPTLETHGFASREACPRSLQPCSIQSAKEVNRIDSFRHSTGQVEADKAET